MRPELRPNAKTPGASARRCPAFSLLAGGGYGIRTREGFYTHTISNFGSRCSETSAPVVTCGGA